MRRTVRFAAWAALAASAAGCNAIDNQYFRQGVGTELAWSDIGTATELQNIYLDHLCRQSQPFVGAVASCSDREVHQGSWPLIVQAGMNDIDQRCDSFLAWLDRKKRENAAVLAEISAVRVAVDALVNPGISPGVTPTTLAAVAAAFGLATSTFNNINSLLLQVDHTTVQSVVFINRRNFREKTLNLALAINNKPAAVHTLRSYLTICMPMTISANINSTVTVFQQAGPNALDQQQLVSTTTIGKPFTPRAPFSERKPPDVPADKFRLVSNAATIIDGYPGNARTYTREVIGTILDSLCAPASDLNGITRVTKALLEIWEETDLRNAIADGKIDDRERRVLLARTPCPTDKVLNGYERQTFMSGSGEMRPTQFLITLLDKAPPATANGLPGGGIFNRTATLQEARTRIAQLRRDCFAGLKKLPNGMTGQVTRDFVEALQAYADKRAAGPAPVAGQPPPPLPAC